MPHQHATLAPALTCRIPRHADDDTAANWGRRVVSRDLAGGAWRARLRLERGLHTMTAMHSSRYALLALLPLASCREADGSNETRLRPAAVEPSANAPRP